VNYEECCKKEKCCTPLKSEDQTVCPHCGCRVIWYSTNSISRAVCANKCHGWEVVKEIVFQKGRK
jgi:hypothetical protein